MVSLELAFDVASGVIFPPRSGLVWRSLPPPIDVLKISIAMASTDRSIFHPFWSYYDGIARCFTCRNLECRNIFVYLRFTTFYNQATFTLSLFFCYLFWRAWIRSWKLSAEEQDGLPCIAVREKPWCRRPLTPFEPFQGKSGKIVEQLKKMMLLCLYSGRLRIKFPLQVWKKSDEQVVEIGLD